MIDFYLEEALLKEGAPLCQSALSRAQVYSTVMEVASKNDQFRYLGVSHLSRYHFEDGATHLRWRTHNITDWSIGNQLQTETRGKSSYSGLRNLGCTCYMNSLLQQFFMIVPFREAVLGMEDERDNVEPADNMITQLKRMFIELQHTQSAWCDTIDFAKALKDPDGQGGKIDIAV